MSAYNSDQVTSVTVPPVALLKPNEFRGIKRTLRFSFTVGGSNVPSLNATDTVSTQYLPKGARILASLVTYSAAGASTTLSIGLAASKTGSVAANPTAFLSAQSVAAAGSTLFANTQALGYGTELTDDTQILLTAGGAAFAAATVIQGDIEYVID